MHIFAYLISKLRSEHHHGYTDEQARQDDENPGQSGEMLKQKVQVSLLRPPCNMEHSMNYGKDQDSVATVHM